MKKIKSDFGLLMRSCRLINEITPHLLLLSVINSVIKAVAPFFTIVLSALIIDALIEKSGLDILLFYVFLSTCVTLILYGISEILGKKINVLNNMFEPEFKRYLNNFRLSQDFLTLENPEFNEQYANITGMMFMVNGGINSVVRLLSQVTGNGVSIILSFIIVLRSIDIAEILFGGDNGASSFIYMAITILIIVICFIIMNKNAKTVAGKEYQLVHNSPVNKYLEYYHFNYMGDDKAAEEIQIFNQKCFIYEQVWSKGRQHVAKILCSRYSAYQKYFGANQVISALVGGIIYAFVGLRAIAGIISVGNVAMSYSAINALISSISALSNSLSEIRSNNNYVKRLFEFLENTGEPNGGSLIPKTDSHNWEIAFHNVSFKYPGSEDFAIKNVSFSIAPDNRIAVVGTNGSGKTTMVKLLCGIYRPDSGTITLNGVDIRNYNREAYLKLISIVFQDFSLFALPVGENVAVSKTYDKSGVWEAIKVAGAEEAVKRMPLQLENYIYRNVETDGVEISGGEAQKIAIARAYYKNAQIVILDEPTSALDPISENEIYSKFNEITRDKMTIFISHRLSSCKFCDKILVFDHGEITQSGSHEQLLKCKEGKYYEMWNAQASYYRK